MPVNFSACIRASAFWWCVWLVIGLVKTCMNKKVAHNWGWAGLVRIHVPRICRHRLHTTNKVPQPILLSSLAWTWPSEVVHPYPRPGIISRWLLTKRARFFSKPSLSKTSTTAPLSSLANRDFCRSKKEGSRISAGDGPRRTKIASSMTLP